MFYIKNSSGYTQGPFDEKTAQTFVVSLGWNCKVKSGTGKFVPADKSLLMKDWLYLKPKKSRYVEYIPIYVLVLGIVGVLIYFSASLLKHDSEKIAYPSSNKTITQPSLASWKDSGQFIAWIDWVNENEEAPYKAIFDSDPECMEVTGNGPACINTKVAYGLNSEVDQYSYDVEWFSNHKSAWQFDSPQFRYFPASCSTFGMDTVRKYEVIAYRGVYAGTRFYCRKNNRHVFLYINRKKDMLEMMIMTEEFVIRNSLISQLTRDGKTLYYNHNIDPFTVSQYNLEIQNHKQKMDVLEKDFWKNHSLLF